MPKQKQTEEETPNLPEEIPPETILTVEEDSENPSEILLTSIPNTIPLTPRDLVNLKAREAREARKIPPVPGYAPSIEQFEDYLKLLDDNMWSHVVPYLYRAWPKIVRQLSDPENKSYIDIICKEHVDRGLINYLQDTHGGGTYKFIVLDLDQKSPKGDSKAIMQFSFKIDPSEYDPILNLKEIDVNHKPNMGFINQMVSKGLMDSKGNVMQPNQNGSGTGGAEMAGAIGGVYDKFMTTFAAMNKDQQSLITKLLSDGSNRKSDPEGIGALLLEKLKQDDPSKQTQTMMTMITTMMSLIPKQEKQDNTMFQMILTMMKDSAEKQMEMMKMMMQNNQPVEKEDFLDKLVKYQTALPGLFGGGQHREPKKETAEIILDGVKEFALPAIGLVSQFLQLRGANPIVPVTEGQALAMAQQAGMQGTGAQPSPQAQQQQNPNPKVLPMPSQPQPQNEPVKDSTGKPILDPNNLTLCQKLIIQYGGMLITAIKSGMDGATLADNLEGAKPLIGDIYGMLKAQGGEEILKAMESIPEFWNQTGMIYGKDHMEQLIADFLLDPIDDDDEEEGKDGKEIVQ